MKVFTHPEFDWHEHISFVTDEATGLKAIIAIHRTTRFGGGSGGCRMWPYSSEDEAITDALRLSRTMSYKLALAGLPMGGAKMVVIGDPSKDKSEELLRAIGRVVNHLKGRYVTGGDVGVGEADLKFVAQETKFVLDPNRGGDPAEATAYGVLVGIQTSVQERLEREDLAGVRVAVQGLGAVGRSLCGMLAERGAKLVVTDINDDLVKQVVEEHGAQAVRPDDIYDQDVDVYAPCALGATINDDTIDRLKATVIAGCANNQLAENRHADALKERKILYAPDFVVNAGSAMSVIQRAQGQELNYEAIEKVGKNLRALFDTAKSQDINTHLAAEELARERAPHLRPKKSK